MCDLSAEQATLGAMLISGPAVDDVADACAARDFYRPAHQVVAEALLAQRASGEPTDAVAIADRLAHDGNLRRAGGKPYLHTLMAAVPSAANAGYYAGIVREWAIRRRIEQAGTRMVQRAREPGAGVAEILAGAESDLAHAVTDAAGNAGDVLTADQFISQVEDSGEELIDGLLYKQERVIVVAAEGIGKSVLGRQVGFATAAGLHPFTADPITPRRVLRFDFENPPYIDRIEVGRVVNRARACVGSDWQEDRAWNVNRTAGADLASPADQAEIAQIIRDTKPELIVAGPLYKMIRAHGDRAEPAHAAVADFLDRMRERFGVAWWLESHAPMAQNGRRELRPLDWGGWMRWPEFGIALQPLDNKRPEAGVRLEKFRGDRDKRLWPVQLIRAGADPIWPFPFRARYPAGTFGQTQAS